MAGRFERGVTDGDSAAARGAAVRWGSVDADGWTRQGRYRVGSACKRGLHRTVAEERAEALRYPLTLHYVEHDSYTSFPAPAACALE